MVKKCVLGYDVGRRLEKGELKEQHEIDLWLRVTTHFSDTLPTDLIREREKGIYICTKYEGNHKICKLSNCPAYKNQK
jgi:hypothetical protein